MSARSVTFVALFTTLVMSIAACSAATGPLGSPQSPALTPDPSGQPTPSDAAPGTPAPTATPEPTDTPTGSDSPSTSGSPTPVVTPTPTPAGSTIVRAYFVLGSFNGNEGLVPVLREVPATKAVAKAAMTQLLGGPQGVELQGAPAMFSFIPEGTQLVDLSISNGVATVILSKEFAQVNDNVGATTARAQVVYTLTQFTTVKQVSIGVEGSDPEPAAARADFQSIALPDIFVDRPAWNAAAGNPAHVTGLANVFEATFRVQILDGKGNVLADKQVMATCGTGCWGSFKTDIGYTIGKAQYGTLRVFALSAKDGTPQSVTDYRVWLTPAS